MGVVDEIGGGWATLVYSNHWEGRLVGWFEEYASYVLWLGMAGSQIVVVVEKGGGLGAGEKGAS